MKLRVRKDNVDYGNVGVGSLVEIQDGDFYLIRYENKGYILRSFDNILSGYGTAQGHNGHHSSIDKLINSIVDCNEEVKVYNEDDYILELTRK